jgi:hypothetical protein
MPTTISVGRSFREPTFLYISAPVLIMWGVAIFLLLSPNPDAGLDLATFVWLCLLPSLFVGVLALRIYLGRRWLTDTGTGFIYTDFRGSAEVEDKDVTGLGSRLSLSYPRDQTITTRTAVIVVGGENGRECSVCYSYPTTASDPLNSLFERLEKAIAEEAERKLAGGMLVRGKGWTLGSDELRLDGDPKPVPLIELVSAEMIDHQACVWDRDESDPLLRIDEDEINAALLVKLLQTRLPTVKDDLAGEGLGRFLFRRDLGWGYVRYWGIAGVGFAVFASTYVAVAVHTGDIDWIVGCLLGIMLVLGLLIILGIQARTRIRILECYQNGIRLSTYLGQRTILLDDLESIAYWATARATSDSYAHLGNRFCLDFRLKTGGSRLRFGFNSLGQDTAIDEFSDAIATRIAARWLKDWKASGYQKWTNRLAFTSTGLQIVNRQKIVPYSELGNISGHKGYFYLNDKSNSELLICEATSVPNFFAGFKLLEILIEMNRPSNAEQPKTE